jgi:hypothetical protein
MSQPATIPATAPTARRLPGIRAVARTALIGFVGATLSCGIATTADAQPAKAAVQAMAGTPGDYDTAVLTDGPQFYWPLNETTGPVRDATGRAAASTTTTGQLGSAGASGTGISFDGGSQRVQVPYTSSMRMTGSFTVELWAKLPASPQATGWPTLFSRGNTGPGHFGEAMWVSADAAHTVSFKRNGYDVATARGLNSAAYRHLVFTWDSAAQRYTWYVDGTLDSSNIVAKLAGVDTETAPLSIGAMLESATASPYAFGRLLVDGLTIYNKVLPGYRVAAHYTAAGVKPATPPAAARRVGGVAIGDLQPWNTRRVADYAAMSAANATWIRTDIGWKYLQPTANEWRWDLFDGVLADMNAKGLRYLAILHAIPGWANGYTGDYATPADLSLLTNYCYQAVRHYLPLGVADYEIGNEVNYAHDGWVATGANYARNYLIPCAAGARRAAAELNRPVNLIFGSTGPGTGTAGAGQDPRTFLAEAYANGARGLTDAVAFHPYGGLSPVIDSNMTTLPTELYNIMVANGDGAKKLWATEYGLPTGGDSSWGEQVQVEWMNAAFDAWYAKPFAGPLFWYSHRDIGTSATDREQHFGVLRYDGSAKPAYATLTARLTR